MKANEATPPRLYQQTSRALSAEANGRRIVEAFIKRLGEMWFEEITLEMVAKDAEVTVQTIMRRFGSKAGLLDAASRQLEAEIVVRRAVQAGDIHHAVNAVTDDYETVGDLVLRLLGQEERHPVLKPAVDMGRRGHREWLSTVFAAELAPLTPAKRTAMLDALVIATDIYIWKLVRRDMGRSVSAFKTIVKNMLQAALHGPAGSHL